MLNPMHRVTLPNGLRVIHKSKPGNVVVVEVMIQVGSNNEGPAERGIAHFLEHALFEGTTKRPTNQLISNEIEKIGGEFNAYTTGDRTCFYVKVLKKHFKKAVDILSDILQNPLFKESHVEKEKNIVIKEIDMVHDEPNYYQWALLQQSLFTKHPAKYPTYGDKKVIKNLTTKKVREYFETWYVPNNMVVSVVGEVKNWKEEITKKFTLPTGDLRVTNKIKEPAQTKNKLVRQKRKMVNTYTLLAFKTVPRPHDDSYVLEIINGILGRGQSGKMFIEIRSKRGLAYEVGTQNIGEVSHGYFAIYATVNRKNVKLVRDLVLQEIANLQSVTQEEVNESKTFVEGNYLLDMENAQKVADQVVFWEQVKSAQLMDTLLKKAKQVTVSDVKRVAKKYFNFYTQVVIEGK